MKELLLFAFAIITMVSCGDDKGIQYVDLGLSVKWATCNIGARKPEEYGNYYAWGETSTKSIYDPNTYTFCNGSLQNLTKYCTKKSFGIVDNKTVLKKRNDIGSVTFGGKWRTPTDAEWTELRKKCKWTWTTVNGVSGYKVEAKNGNSIFFPAAGCYYQSSISHDGDFGYYWSSSLYKKGLTHAWSVRFYSDYVVRRSYDRSIGFSVRPVLCSK